MQEETWKRFFLDLYFEKNVDIRKLGKERSKYCPSQQPYSQFRYEFYHYTYLTNYFWLLRLTLKTAETKKKKKLYLANLLKNSYCWFEITGMKNRKLEIQISKMADTINKCLTTCIASFIFVTNSLQGKQRR